MPLRLLIDDMELPPARKDLTQIKNLIWLQKNMQTRNGEHPNYKDAFRAVNYILRENGVR